MIIQETTVPDVTEENLNKSKQTLAENIIKNVYPLFNEVYNSKLSGVDKLKYSLTEKRMLVKEKKNELQILIEEYKRTKKISKLLGRIEKLITSGLVYDGALKNETVIILRIVNTFSNDKLDHHLSNVLKNIGKRFSR